MAKLFVGNLPWATTGDDLNDMFSKAGAVTSAVVIKDRDGRSKGFGFVEMSDEDAKKAIETYNGMDMGGRAIVVNEARPMQPRDRGGFGGGNRRFNNNRDF